MYREEAAIRRIRNHSIAFLFAILLAIYIGACGGNDSFSNPTSDNSNSQGARIIQLDPFWAMVDDAEFTLQLSGENFTSESVVLWNGRERQTRFINSAQIETSIANTDVASREIVNVSIRNANGTESNHLPFFVKTSTPKFLYFTVFDEPSYIYAFSIDSSTGDLVDVPGSPFEFPKFCSFLQVAPNGEHLYVLDCTEPSVLRLSVDRSTGALSETGTFPLLNNDLIIMDPAGEFLFTRHGWYAIDSVSGNLSSLPVSLDGLPGIFDASARFAFKFEGNRYDETDYTVKRYWLNRETAELEFLGSQSFGSGYTALGAIAGPAGRRLLGMVQDSLDMGSLIPFNIDQASGVLERAPGSIRAWRPFGARFHISGRYVYVSELFSPRIVLSNVDLDTGAISLGPAYELPYDNNFSIAEGPVGRYLYTISGVSSTAGPYYLLSITIEDQTGALLVTSATEVLVDRGPGQISIVY
jgi:6-phosphogluconolactonase (cycloisomerase 2 family)